MDIKQIFLFKNQLEQDYNDVISKYEMNLIFSEILKDNEVLFKTHENLKLSSKQAESIKKVIKERIINKQSIESIFKKAYFYGTTLEVDKNVLSPRNETEILVEYTINKIRELNKPVSVLDIGTGSGCISVAIANSLDNVKIDAIDISKDAIAIAKKNVAKYNLEKVINVFESDVFSKVSNKYDIIISNPPYIAKKEIDKLSSSVLVNDPILALDGGEDGLDFYNRIIDEAPKYLLLEGYLFFEVGYNQAKEVKNRMELSFHPIEIYKDYQQHERIVIGKKR